MTWFRVDDGLYDHPKVVKLAEGPRYGQALSLWLLAGSWASRHLTDGYVPEGLVKRLGFELDDAMALVECGGVTPSGKGLWVRDKGGFRFHEWAHHQPSREEVQRKRQSNARRVREYRQRKAEEKQRRAEGAQDGPRAANGNAECNALRNAPVRSPRPDPTRTQLTPQTPQGGPGAGPGPKRVTSARRGYEPSIHVPLMREAIGRAHQGGSVPRLTPGVLQQAAERAHEHVEHFGGDFEASALAMAKAARQRVRQGKGARFGFELLEVDFVGGADAERSLSEQHHAAMAAWQDPGF